MTTTRTDLRRNRNSWARIASVALLFLVASTHVPQLRQAQSEEQPSGSGAMSSQVAAAFIVAVTDYLALQKEKGGSATPSAFASRTHAVSYATEGNRIAIHILEGTPLTFGGGVSYWIDLKDYAIIERRFGR